MTTRTELPAEQWTLGPGPFIFAGRPPLLTGDVELTNVSDLPVRIKAIPTAERRAKRGRSIPAIGDVRLMIRLAPGSTARAHAQVTVDPITPPGTYEIELLSGDQRESAILHVFASRGVHLRPRPVELSGRAGESLSHVVVATNRGNVAYRVPTGLPLTLREPGWAAHAVMSVLRDTPPEESRELVRDRLSRELRAALPRPARVRVKSGTKELAPGQTMDLQVEVHLPTGLVKGMTYVGSTPFLGSTLAFKIECTGGRAPQDRRAQ
jgi:hypothetical protein